MNNRSKFQGVKNIINFNSHQYKAALVFILISFIFYSINFLNLKIIFLILIILISFNVLSSIIFSYIIYDKSDLYRFDRIRFSGENLTILNITAGFDETTEILKNKFPNSEILVLDFYNEEAHTELSIKKARKVYPQSEDVIKINTTDINLRDNFADKIFLIFSLHEIRNREEKINFINELYRVLKDGGEIVIIEHLRNLNNFIAYSVGFFHFYSNNYWRKVFKESQFTEIETFKINSFINLYTLKK